MGCWCWFCSCLGGSRGSAQAAMAVAGLKELPSREGAGISESPAAEELLCHFLLSSPLQTPLSWGGELCAPVGQDVLPCCCSLQPLSSGSFSWRASWPCLRRDFPKGSVDGGWRRHRLTGRARRPLLEMFASRLSFCCEGGDEIGGDGKSALVQSRTLAEALVSSKWWGARFPTPFPALCLHILYFHTCSCVDGQDVPSLSLENFSLNIWVFWFIAVVGL